eukprot:GDKI01000127.1.p1 GENE.GDKI01000127.1~~GDKI01000127.1.p1  ORF type:complete len:280 (+),score=44.51 GDKI01000127.1:462-1301(+)
MLPVPTNHARRHSLESPAVVEQVVAILHAHGMLSVPKETAVQKALAGLSKTNTQAVRGSDGCASAPSTDRFAISVTKANAGARIPPAEVIEKVKDNAGGGKLAGEASRAGKHNVKPEAAGCAACGEGPSLAIAGGSAHVRTLKQAAQKKAKVGAAEPVQKPSRPAAQTQAACSKLNAGGSGRNLVVISGSSANVSGTTNGGYTWSLPGQLKTCATHSRLRAYFQTKNKGGSTQQLSHVIRTRHMQTLAMWHGDSGFAAGFPFMFGRDGYGYDCEWWPQQ